MSGAETMILRKLAIASLVLSGLASIPVPVAAQASPSAYTSAARYDAMGRTVGTIAPDPDGTGPLKYAATRTTYDVRGNVTKIETGELSTWKSETVAPANWGASFTVLSSVETTYDALNRKTTERVKGSDGVTTSLTQYSYDNRGRPECTAIRMNPAAYNSLPASACTLGTEGSFGPDRITRLVYDAAGQLLQIRKAVGTPIEIADVTYNYTNNGKVETVIDANGNRAEQRYDGHDRQTRWVFPSTTRPASFNNSTQATALSSAGALNEGDYEEYGYDANGNRTSLRKRDGSVLSYQYDALNRVTRKTVPARAGLGTIHTRDVFYSHDLRGLVISTRFQSASGQGAINTYDGFGRLTSVYDTIDAKNRTVSYQYDKNGNRTRITHPDGQYFRFSWDGLNRADILREVTNYHLANYNYDARGKVKEMTRLYTTVTPSYDPAGRLSGLDNDLYSTPSDVTWTYTRNPASQILTETQGNDSYSWDGHVDVARTYTANGLNQYSAAGSANFCYDANGNLTADGTSVYLYDIENRLVEKRTQTNTNCASLSYAGTLQAELRYDPLGRLYYLRDYVGPNGITRFTYDGDALIAEYDDGTTLLRRYVHGPNAETDDPLLWYEGATLATSGRRQLFADARGSIVAVTNHVGVVQTINTYDEYGIPDSATGNDIATKGRFRYTGQAWLPELGMYYYKARIYSPTLGRFMQTDPIGYEDGMNIYAYVGNDPINGIDPMGTRCVIANIGSAYCRRRAAYRSYDRDRAIRSKTRFFEAAAQTVEFLANNDLPIAGNVISDKAEAFLRGVSAGLEKQNARMAAEARTSRSTNLDIQFVKREQTAVQRAIDSLSAKDRKEVVGSINRSFQTAINYPGSVGFLSASDRAYVDVLKSVQDGLGVNIDFGNQAHREAIGVALINRIRGCEPDSRGCL